MKPAFCNEHGVQSFVTTSPLLEKLIENKKTINKNKIRKINIQSLGKDFEIQVDDEFFFGFFGLTDSNEIFLLDRDKAQKKLNDRLLIQKITSKLKWVCPICLKNIAIKEQDQS